MSRSERRKRGKLQVFSIGLADDQVVHLEVLERVTGKSKGRIIRDAIDAYFRQYRVGNDTLGEAELRFRKGQEADSED